MIRVTDSISIDESEIEESFVRSSGPGGQNVNKLSTAVQLRFDVRRSPSMPNDVAIRLMRLAGKRMTKDGVLVLIAMQTQPVSLVAPLRETSIVIGSLLGWLIFKEANPGRRLLGAAVVLGGVALISG